jgi:3-hydroxybutyrate dehydrogenase
MNVQDQTVIVTGAGSGIGRTIALRFAQAGAIVGVVDINLQAALLVSEEINMMQQDSMPIQMDVANEDSVNLGIDQFYSQYGRIDVLISNAGIQHIDAIHELSLENWHRVLRVHLDGAFLTTKACLQKMYAAKQGSIVYIGSGHSFEASKLKAPYVTAKHGLIGLCRTVAKEAAAYQVKANVVCPGYVKTPLVEQQIPIQMQELGLSEDEVVKKVMLGNTVDCEFTTADDIADACLYFASAKNLALTGQSLVVSHGWGMK